MNGQHAGTALQDVDPYVAVRAQLLARQWENSTRPRAQWFQALATAGLTGVLTKTYRNGLPELLTAAEVIGAHAAPLSFPAAAGSAAALAVSDNNRAGELLAAMLAGGKPVLPALQSGAKTLKMGAGGGLRAKPGADGSIVVTGARIAVPDAAEAAAFIAEAEGPDGIAVFLFDAGLPGMTMELQPDACGNTLGSFSFQDCTIAAGNILARGAEALAMLDRTRFSVQLGLAADLSGLAAALLTRAGAAQTSEAGIADALMDATLARALTYGAAAMAHPANPHALEYIAGARAAASQACLKAAQTALATVREEKHRAVVAGLARRALVASRIYRQPQAHKLRFVNWRWSAGESTNFTDLFSAAGAFANGNTAGKPSTAIGELIQQNNRVRIVALDAGIAEDLVFRDAHGAVELDLAALVCADAQQQAGSPVPEGFVRSAAARTRQRLAASLLHAAGTHAAYANGEIDFAAAFLDQGQDTR